MEKSIRIKRVSFGSRHAIVALALHNYAVLMHKMGRKYEAETAYLEAVDIRTELFGTNHPSTQESIRNLQLLKAAEQQSGGGAKHRDGEASIDSDGFSEDNRSGFKDGISVGSDYHVL
jgi:hypothetical protein